MKSKLSSISSRWRRLAIRTILNTLLFLSMFTSPRARAHWLGRHGRPRRRERALFFLCFFGGMFLLDSDQLLLWTVMWGGAFSLFVNLHTVYRFLPRRRVHWIR